MHLFSYHLIVYNYIILCTYFRMPKWKRVRADPAHEFEKCSVYFARSLSLAFHILFSQSIIRIQNKKNKKPKKLHFATKLVSIANFDAWIRRALVENRIHTVLLNIRFPKVFFPLIYWSSYLQCFSFRLFLSTTSGSEYFHFMNEQLFCKWTTTDLRLHSLFMLFRPARIDVPNRPVL